MINLLIYLIIFLDFVDLNYEKKKTKKKLTHSHTFIDRMVTVSSSDMGMDGSRKQLIYIFEGADSPSGSMGPPISLEFRQTIVPRFETPNGSILGICTYSKGIL